MKSGTVIMRLAVAGALAFLAGCGGTSEAQTESIIRAEETDNHTATYSIFQKFSAPEYPADGGLAKKLILDAMQKEGLKGIDYKIEFAPGQDYMTKLNLKATAGELPDLFQVDYPTFMRLVNEGKLLPLNDWLAKSPHVSGMIRDDKFDYVTVNGYIYAIPTGNRPEPYNSESRAGFIVRQDWLDRLGLKAPRNLDEMHEVLRAFTYGDPDGNGINDTYGYGAAKDHQFAGIFGAFGIHPDFWHERGGMIKKGYVLPEAKEALAVLQSWYKEGLIDPHFLVTETKRRNENIIRSQYGMFQNAPLEVDPNSSTIAALHKANPGAKLRFFTNVKGPDGKSGFPESSPFGSLRAVSANVKQPEKLFRMLDWMQNENGGFNLIHYGVEGEDYSYEQAANRIVLHSEYAQLYRRGFSNPIRFLNDIDVRWASDEVKQDLVEAARHTISNALWKKVPAELDYADLDEDLWGQYFSKIVTGQYSVDRWDEFVKLYYQQGGDIIEQQANEEWKKMKATAGKK
ncbi:extracellular solute-binding protein [Paenibacillus allorhizosphaerae]|uniref:Lipoprotein LipO n=1 Tax=Paenibacillus allorhizosphaerae TaxID=2849866 RepID=A0ABN7TSF3_9BACL|nr:extracellular solute-binding protein [Paenibacillus allorhizosphaerae]CAG7649312.1 Lipoprotein LipO [Paenibacillus allorhizosphaerae]